MTKLIDCPNPDCMDGVVEDPDQCGDRDHCPGGMECPVCRGTGKVAEESNG